MDIALFLIKATMASIALVAFVRFAMFPIFGYIHDLIAKYIDKK